MSGASFMVIDGSQVFTSRQIAQLQDARGMTRKRDMPEDPGICHYRKDWNHA